MVNPEGVEEPKINVKPHSKNRKIFEKPTRKSEFRVLALASARMDGASHMKILTAIIIPIATPGIAAPAILTFLGAWGQYAVLLIFSPKIT